MSSPEEIKQLEAALTAPSSPSSASWQRIRSGFMQRAQQAGLIDVAFETHESPFGTLLVGATDRGLVRVALAVESEDQVLDQLAKQISARTLRASHPSITAARYQLDQYFAGQRKRFELELDWQLTKGFRRQALRATAAIPYGQTRSYKEIAAQTDSPAAVRAAGSAMATNPLPIVVPCHRVLRSDGMIGAYLGGTEMKAQLLSLESQA